MCPVRTVTYVSGRTQELSRKRSNEQSRWVTTKVTDVAMRKPREFIQPRWGVCALRKRAEKLVL
jgi:hypothetical protein